MPIIVDAEEDSSIRRLEDLLQYFKVEMTVPMQVKDATELAELENAA